MTKKRKKRRNPSELDNWTPFLLGATGLIGVLYLFKKLGGGR